MLTEIIDLPSKGRLYPKDHPLSSGQIEIKYMTAKEEDILTTQSYIEKDILLEKLLESVIVTEGVNPSELIVGDREWVLLQTRILGYGPEYTFKYNGKNHTVNLSEVGFKGKPELFENTPYIDFELKTVGKTVTVKIPNSNDVETIREEIQKLEELNQPVGLVSVRLAHLIKSVDGDESDATIRELSKNMPSRDSLALRTFINAITPDANLVTEIDGEEVDIPMGINFLYPTEEA